MLIGCYTGELVGKRSILMGRNVSPALLVLADGSVYHGTSVGANGCQVGELVFNTAMTGYQEIMTDPSYCKQIITFTYPHIGNTGSTDLDLESRQIFASGFVFRDIPGMRSSWRGEKDLSDYLISNNAIAIAGVDTRSLAAKLREHGAMTVCIMAGDDCLAENATDQALLQAKDFAGLAGLDLAKVVSTSEPYHWAQGVWNVEHNSFAKIGQAKFKVIAYDFGIKHNILRLLADRGCDVEVVPATTPANEVLARNPDGIFLSNGPGDPEPCDYAVAAIKTFLEKQIPLFGICLGFQLLGLAGGAKTLKMKFGHHGANHPIVELETGKVFITSQNHGFAVDEESLPQHIIATHRSLFDHSLAGLKWRDQPAFGFQGHPEASPGPHDILPLFDQFITMMENSVQTVSVREAI